MIRNKSRIVSGVWSLNMYGNIINTESNIIDVYIKRLRSKIEKVGHPKILQSIRGVGYRMREVTPDDTEQIEDYSDDE